MTPKEFFDLVSEMRHFQREFFRHHQSKDFHKSVDLEKLVDAEIDRVLDLTGGRKAKERQTKLF